MRIPIAGLHPSQRVPTAATTTVSPLLRSYVYHDGDIGPRGGIWTATTADAFWKIDVSSIKRYVIPARRRGDFSDAASRTLDRSADDRKPATDRANDFGNQYHNDE